MLFITKSAGDHSGTCDPSYGEAGAGVDILQKKSKNAQGGINSAQAKFPEIPKLSGFFLIEIRVLPLFLL